ncbi:Serine/Threonine kinase domain protein (macronuclear) [Tetrahymena thermophila SB210]|uniref:Serine/Threonine kinase domain protein n=1 Tax=Tetrahymena thermophila (strain SB210) TaxID=312017 RepID=Q23WP1_TETTS|nr:Serine/Threonine kinase domain protein [Tetrahymena thermophila SB210]EAS00939.2 Serine/Threonine kinase domain protein [Tetrahymena thermophila SB210]|eukprot:XP_001021184.2 Serine/Threonine kinase domain protein [Tetrahymena thermophila SB210]
MITQMIQQKKDQKPKSSSQQVEEEENHLMNSISTSLHNFKITLTLGRGAGSCVFLIEEYKSGSLYALKTITKQSQYYTNNINRIKNEYNLHSQLDHPNIVKILKRFEDNEYVYMMLEYCPGGSLFDYVKSKGRLNEDEARDISYQIVQGLEYLHKNKIIHRDLKPGNILLTGNNSVKICDFGLAVRVTNYESERDTFCGTPNYIAPEICSREKYGIQSDCWSFGCILYTIATGRPPFETVSIQQTLKMLQKKNKVEYPSHLSKSLVDLIDHILDWNQDTRYNISQIKSHPFYNKSKQNTHENEYKLQNPMTFAPPQPFQMEQSVNQNNKNIQQGHTRQRSNFSMDSSNNSKHFQQNKIMNDNLYQINNINRSNQIQENNVLQNKQTKENRFQSKEQLLVNENKENIHSNILNSINNQQKLFQQQQKLNPIPLQKSYSYNQKNEQKQDQILHQTLAQGLKKEVSEQSIDNNRNKQIIQEIQNISQNSYYNPQISQSNKQQQQQIDTIQQKPQSKTILNTFLNKATKSNSLHQSSSTTPSSNQQNINTNNFFQSQKSYKNPIVQILNGFPNDSKIQQNQAINHQKNKSLDISGIIPPQPPRPRDEQKNQLSFKTIDQENIQKKQISIDQSNQNEFVTTPSGNNKMFSQSSNNMIFMKENNNSKIQNVKKKMSLHFPTEQTNISQDIISTNTTCRNNITTTMTFPSPSSQQFLAQNNNNQIIINQNIQRQKPSKSTHNNDNNHTSFDISYLKLDSSQMNSFSVERDFQSTAQFSSKSNVIHTPTNVSISQKPPSNKNSYTYRDINPPSFAPSQQPTSLMRAKGSSKEYIKTEPCDIDVNQTPRLECLETENNENTSTAACSKYSMNTTNRSFNKGLNTSKSFSSFIADQTNEIDKYSNNIQLNQQNSNIITSQISPVKVGDDLDVSKIKTKNGYIEITSDHSLLVESCNGRLLFKISKDGQKVRLIFKTIFYKLFICFNKQRFKQINQLINLWRSITLSITFPQNTMPCTDMPSRQLMHSKLKKLYPSLKIKKEFLSCQKITVSRPNLKQDTKYITKIKMLQ